MAGATAILSASDHALARASRRLAPLLRLLGDMEEEFCAARLEALAIDRPVFVTGLARSGTTMTAPSERVVVSVAPSPSSTAS